MKVLVTGHQGYIGSVLVPRLLAAGHEVGGLDSGLFADCWFEPDRCNRDAVDSEPADLRSLDPRRLEGYDAVLHLAALSNDPMGNLDAELTHDINYRASLSLAIAAKEAGVSRFVFSSSCSTYGAADGDDFLDERAEFNPVTPYAVEKVRLEAALADLADDQFSPTYLRNATAYGYSPRLRLDLVLNNLVAWAHTTGEVVLLSDGTAWRPLAHVEDISTAFLLTLDAPRDLIHDEAFNVGWTEHNYRIRDLAEIVAEAIPGTSVKVRGDASPDQRTYRVDCDKLERVLGFQAEWDAARSARRLAEAYRRRGLSQEEFEGPLFVRLKTLERRIGQGVLDSQLRWRGPSSGLPALVEQGTL